MSLSENQQETIIKKLVSTLKNVSEKEREDSTKKAKDMLFIRDFEQGKFQIPKPHWWRYSRKK